jgi:hypothetical protein
MILETMSKPRTIGVLLTAIMILSVSGPVHVDGYVVWSDNFDDGNYDDWTVIDGEFNATGGSLEATDVSGASGAKITHNSSVNIGTWSFDIINPSCQLAVNFLDGSTRTDEVIFFIHIHPYPEITTIKLMRITMTVEPYTTQLGQYNVSEPVSRLNFNVTFDIGWRFNVFINGTHRMSRITESISGTWEQFSFWSDEVGPALDSVAVSNSIDLQGNVSTTPTSPTTPTVTSTPLPIAPQLLLVAGGLVVVTIIAIVFWKLKR